MSVSKSTAVKKQVAKKVVTPKKSPASTRLKRVFVFLSHHKLIIFLIFLVLLFPLSYAYERYKDWDNAQMIKGLARDFPVLVAEIEAATGLDLEINKNCMITQEKAGAGVRTCELIFTSDNNEQEKISTVFSVIVRDKTFVKADPFANGLGFKFTYRNKDSCRFTNLETIYGSCVLGVREKNIRLARELFVE